MRMHIQARSDLYAFWFFFLWFVAHSLFLSYLANFKVLEENLLHKSIVIMQQSSAHFEEDIVKSAWSTFGEWPALQLPHRKISAPFPPISLLFLLVAQTTSSI